MCSLIYIHCHHKKSANPPLCKVCGTNLVVARGGFEPSTLRV